MRSRISTRSRRPNRAAAFEPLEPRRLMSTVVVNTTADSTDAKGSSTVSLRDAIAVANAATSATTITFSPTVFATAKTITLVSQFPGINNASQAITITGPSGGLTINGNNIDVSTVGIYTGKVTIQNLSFTNFKDIGSGATINTGGGGAFAVFPPATLTLTDVTIANCVADFGGAIHDSGKLILTNVTLTDNKATDATTDGGGGLNLDTDASASLSNVTISGNSSASSGGGILNFGKITVANSIIAGNTATANDPDVKGTETSSGYNLIGKTDGSSGWGLHDFTGTVAKPLDAELGALANNGGPTETLLPLTGSPAIDKGSNSLIPSGVTTDQRGLPRTYNGTVDIGAVEVQPLIQIKAPANQKATQGINTSVTLGSFTQYTNATPYKDTITWGDGSASTTLSLTAAGTIPATAHVFAKSGTITVTETITDAKGNESNIISFTETVTAALGSISGTVFDDANGNGKQDKGEVGLGLFTAYLDLKDTGSFVTGDPTATTNVYGDFSFTGLAAGTYYLRAEPVTGETATTPALIKIVLTAGEVSTANLFGEN